MMAALRIEIGRLHDRLPYHPKLRASLVSMSQKLNTFKQDQLAFSSAISDWRNLQSDLAQTYETSLFNKRTIETWVSER